MASTNFYIVEDVDPITGIITIDRDITEAFTSETPINSFDTTMNGVYECIDNRRGGSEIEEFKYLLNYLSVKNEKDFVKKYNSFEFIDPSKGKIKIFSRNPGKWAKELEIAIVNADTFKTPTKSMLFDGIVVNDVFEYVLTGDEVGIVIRQNNEIKEIYVVSFDEEALDYNNKSMYIENVINNKSSLIFVKNNVSNTNPIKNYCYSVDGKNIGTIKLLLGADSTAKESDVIDAYSLWLNKDELDIDIVIGNELDNGLSAYNLSETRKDCITFIGAPGSIVGKKPANIVENIVDWRDNTLNINSSYAVACGNYKYQYDRYNDKYRWVNIAGDIAGLRAYTSSNREIWWASAGLERGQIKNVKKLAFNPDKGHRDILYYNGINPIVSFPGQGTVMWGQKTLLDNSSSFDRVNVRGLFNTIERSLSKMAKYQVMEFNDNFTRNFILSMVNPFLEGVKSKRGIQDYQVICDESNNTPDLISRNQLIVDVYIKPTYVAEFIHLKFTNAGVNDFSSVIIG